MSGLNPLRFYFQVFPSPRPHGVKMKTLKKYGGNDAWVETGTYVGDGARAISNFAKIVHTIEPSSEFINIAQSRLADRNNVKVHHGSSEDLLPRILNSLIASGFKKVSFWLDGHYSGGSTFRGSSETPIIFELKAILGNLSSFSEVTIFVDDVRCFNPRNLEFQTYPEITCMVDFARQNNFKILFTRDICVMKLNKV